MISPFVIRLFVLFLLINTGAGRIINRRPAAAPSLDPRIIGGLKVPAGKYPYMAQLLVNGEESCGATILNDNSLLTAAHCVEEKPRAPGESADAHSALLGLTDLADRSRWRPINITRVHVHHIYRGEYVELGYDLAVVKLAQKIKFSNTIAKVCLPRLTDRPDPTRCVTIGWGRTSNYGPFSDRLLQTSQPIMPHAVCGEAHNQASLKQKILEKYDHGLSRHVICAGTKSTGVQTFATCSGDSGGPLLCPLAGSSPPDAPMFQYGITSFSAYDVCDDGPGYYTNVPYYLDWIREKVEDG